jgi:ribosome-binding ATPase YchF (GTP1/OBG family)
MYGAIYGDIVGSIYEYSQTKEIKSIAIWSLKKKREEYVNSKFDEIYKIRYDYWLKQKAEFEKKFNAPVAIVCVKLEAEMMNFTNEERDEFLQELLEIKPDSKIPTLDDLISLAFNQL